MQTWLPYLTPLARARDIDPVLVAALIAVESAGNPWAYRTEERWRWWYKVEEYAARYQHLGLTVATEKAQQRAGWGLCQIHGTVARERGCEDPFLAILTDPAVNLRFSLAHLAWMREVRGWDSPADMAAAWNWGSPARNPDGTYKAQAYVDKYLAAMQRLREDA